MSRLDSLNVYGTLNVSGNTLLSRDLTVSGILNGNGSGLTSLNASNITSGTLSANRYAYASDTVRGAVRVEVVSDTLYIWTQD